MALMPSMKLSLLETGYILMAVHSLSRAVELLITDTVGLHTQPTYLC